MPSGERILQWLENNQGDLITAVLEIVGSIAVAYLLTRFLRRLVQRVEAKTKEQSTPIRAMQRAETLTRVLTSAGVAVIWTVAVFYVLRATGIDPRPLFAGVGIAGLAIGFGAQNLVKDVVSGFFILLEDQYGVGDVVTVNGQFSGRVEQLTLRMTGVRDLDGTITYISNGSITTVANRTKDWARAIVDVGVGYGEDPEHVREVLRRVAQEAKDDPVLGRKLYSVPEILGVETIGEYQVVWRVAADVKPAQQWDVGRALRERIKVAFDREGIEIPFPYVVTVSPEGKDGAPLGKAGRARQGGGEK